MPSRPWQSPALLIWPQAAILPLVNVALLLIGFILLGPTFLTTSGVALHLPQAVTAEAVGAAGVVITVTDELLYLNGALTTLDELPGRLRSLLAGGGAVLIKADRRVSMGQIAQLWDLCRQLGAAKISMATTQPPA